MIKTVDIAIAALREAHAIAVATEKEFGPMPGVSARVIAKRIEALMVRITEEEGLPA